MKQKYTPGPWDVFRNGPMRSICAGTQPIADMYRGVDKSEDSIEADARLIASAPELLEACHAIAALASGWDEDGAIGPIWPLSWETVARMAMDQARAAIAKVEPKP